MSIGLLRKDTQREALLERLALAFEEHVDLGPLLA
jgi:hypothetical protein